MVSFSFKEYNFIMEANQIFTMKVVRVAKLGSLSWYGE